MFYEKGPERNHFLSIMQYHLEGTYYTFDHPTPHVSSHIAHVLLSGQMSLNLIRKTTKENDDHEKIVGVTLSTDDL